MGNLNKVKEFKAGLSAEGGIDEICKTVKMLKPLKLILGIKDDSKENLLLFLIDSAIELILSHCMIDVLPERLYGIVPEIAADLYRAKRYGGETAPDTVKSISEGDRSVSYADKETEENILARYFQRLKPYINRRGRVPSEL